MAPTTSQNSDAIKELKERMNKYDEILDELKEIVIELRARHETNAKWIMALVGSGCAAFGAAASFILSHLH